MTLQRGALKVKNGKWSDIAIVHKVGEGQIRIILLNCYERITWRREIILVILMISYAPPKFIWRIKLSSPSLKSKRDLADTH